MDSALQLACSASSLLTRGLPERVQRQMFWWMTGTAAWVYSLVVLGGLTRLTRSGLSMTEWKFTGVRGGEEGMGEGEGKGGKEEGGLV